MNEFDLDGYQQKLRKRAEHMSNVEIADMLEDKVIGAINAAGNEFNYKDEHYERDYMLMGAVYEAAKRLRQFAADT